MTRRAYRPSNATLDLVKRIKALDGVESVDIHSPHHGVTVEPAYLIVTLVPGHSIPQARTSFSFSEARAWLALEEEAAVRLP